MAVMTTPEPNVIEPKSICELPHLLARSHVLNVTLEGEFISDRMERSLIQDERCPDIVIAPYDGPRTIKDDVYKVFDGILNADSLQLILVKAYVKVHGTLRKETHNRYRLDVIRYIEVTDRTER
jgi:hypothetical protein